MFMTPDWVLLGAKTGEAGDRAFMVIASDKLTIAAIRVRTKRPDLFGAILFDQITRYYELEAEFDQFKLILGSSYAECLAKLMDVWQPGEQPELPVPELPERK